MKERPQDTFDDESTPKNGKRPTKEVAFASSSTLHIYSDDKSKEPISSRWYSKE
jgi:hypothetical protein